MVLYVAVHFKDTFNIEMKPHSGTYQVTQNDQQI